MKRFLLVLACGAGLAAPLRAQQLQRTQKFDYKPVRQIQEIAFELEKIHVRQIVFRPETGGAGGGRHTAAEAVIRIDNEGDRAAAVGVAVVLFDGDGNVVAAGSGGTRVGFLAPGERDSSTIRFPFLYRNMEKAKTFLVGMEIQPKPPKAGGPVPTPPPSP